MDPEVAYRNILRQIARLKALRAKGDLLAYAEAAEALIESWEALNGWMSKGGFLPADWAAKR
jgi:hypothetical protein